MKLFASGEIGKLAALPAQPGSRLQDAATKIKGVNFPHQRIGFLCATFDNPSQIRWLRTFITSVATVMADNHIGPASASATIFPHIFHRGPIIFAGVAKWGAVG
jgi:hypothetical protein